tara:strand:- start:86 stop:340 length:255 start_codon:yes stop_codon:yes gene_type:complete
VSSSSSFSLSHHHRHLSFPSSASLLSGHWNPTVKQLTNSVIKMYSTGDVKLYDAIMAEHVSSQREKEKTRVKNDARWEQLTPVA